MIYYIDENITIRDLVKNDVNKLFSWWIDESVNIFDPRPIPNDAVSLIKECNLFCDKFDNLIMNENKSLNKYKYFMITDINENPVGFINLFNFSEENTEAELGIVIGEKSSWNKGIGYNSCKYVLRYLFSELGMKRIWIETNVKNIPSVNLFSKLGFSNCDKYEEDGCKFIVMEKKSD